VRIVAAFEIKRERFFNQYGHRIGAQRMGAQASSLAMSAEGANKPLPSELLKDKRLYAA